MAPYVPHPTTQRGDDWVPPGGKPNAPTGPVAPHETGATNPDSALDGRDATVPDGPPSEGRVNGQVVRFKRHKWMWDERQGDWVHKGRVSSSADRELPTFKEAVFDKPDVRDRDPQTEGEPPDTQPATDTTTTVAPEPVADPAATDPGTSAGVPGGYRLWKIGKNFYLVYAVPGTKPAVPMAWKVRDNDLEAVLGSGKHKPDKVYKDWKEARKKRGVLGFGTTDELNNTSEHPFDVFKNDYEKEAQIQPWLRDPEVLALTTMAILEGRAVTDAEFKTTKWWQTHTDLERQALADAASDPMTFQRKKNDALRDVETWLREAGFDFSGGNRNKVVGFLVNQLMTGKMDENDLKIEIERISNPYDPNADPTAGFDELPAGAKAVRHKGRTYVRIGDKDYKLAKGFETAKFGVNPEAVESVNVAGIFRDHLNKTGTPQGRDSVEGIERIRDLILTHIGPALASQFPESEIAKWAQKISGNAAQEEVLVSTLRGIRKAAFGDTYDENLTYAEIAVPARSLVQNVWGERMDEKDPLFQKILKMNDQMQAAQLLRSEGMKRGNRAVLADWSAGAMQALGDGVMPVLGG